MYDYFYVLLKTIKKMLFTKRKVYRGGIAVHPPPGDRSALRYAGSIPTSKF